MMFNNHCTAVVSSTISKVSKLNASVHSVSYSCEYLSASRVGLLMSFSSDCKLLPAASLVDATALSLKRVVFV